MARWLVGTSGYVYRDWRRRFYPQALGARGRLPYYAATFDTVELNNDGRAAAVRNARRLAELLRTRAHRRAA